MPGDGHVVVIDLRPTNACPGGTGKDWEKNKKHPHPGGWLSGIEVKQHIFWRLPNFETLGAKGLFGCPRKIQPLLKLRNTTSPPQRIGHRSEVSIYH